MSSPLVSSPIAALVSVGGAWPPPPRASLPPWPSVTNQQPAPPQASCWADDLYTQPLPYVPPPTPTLDFHRGNFCGLRVPGAPYVPGSNAQHPDLIMTWFLYLYPPEWQTTILQTYVAAGYTHIDFHLPDWRGKVDGIPACSITEAVAICALAKSYGLFVTVNVLPGDEDTIDPSLPWLDALTAAGVVNILCVAWQIDKYYQANLVDVTLPVVSYSQAHGLKTCQQWLNEACALWPYPQYDIYNRFDYARFMNGKIDYQYAQFDVNASVDAIQSQTAKLLQAYQGLSTKLVLSEYDAQAEYDNPDQRLELYGDQKGRLLQAASGYGLTCSGYLNGARREDGSVL